jgi:hypothetical protein
MSGDQAGNRPHIALTATEEVIFDKILRATADVEVEVRVAGGWVRDKLLGRESEVFSSPLISYQVLLFSMFSLPV